MVVIAIACLLSFVGCLSAFSGGSIAAFSKILSSGLAFYGFL